MRLSFTYSDLICVIRVLSVANVFGPAFCPTSPNLLPKYDPVAVRRPHEKEQWQRQPRVRTRSNKGLAREFRRGGRPGTCGSRDDPFVVGPNDAPNIEHHHDAVRAANAD